MKVFTTAFLFVLLANLVQAQKAEGPDPIIGVHFSYGFQFPGADLKEDFGSANVSMLGVEYMNSKNWILGLEGGIFFGDKVNNDVISDLRGPDSLIIGANRGLADIRLKERGIQIGGHIGKLFPFKNAKNRSGIRATVGLGLLQHKVRIQEDFQSATPQLSREYIKGYDQLTNGMAVTQYIGYQLLSKNGLVNFRIGMEFAQAFTQNRRSWDFVENRKIDDMRLDFTNTFKLSWILPFYLTARPDEIFY